MYTHSVWSVKSVPEVKRRHHVKQKLLVAAEKRVSASDVIPRVSQWPRCDQHGSCSQPTVVTPGNHQCTQLKGQSYTFFSICSQRIMCTAEVCVKRWVFKASFTVHNLWRLNAAASEASPRWRRLRKWKLRWPCWPLVWGTSMPWHSAEQRCARPPHRCVWSTSHQRQ